MKLSKNTIAVLKNFSGISTMLRVRPGNVLLTAPASRSVIAQAIVEESFETDMGIYDLPQFLGALSLFEDPDVELGSQYITIKEGRRTINLLAGSTKVVEGPKRFPVISEPIISFPFTSDLLTKVGKAASILTVPDVCVVGNGEEVSVEVFDKKKGSGSSFTQVVGQSDKTFKAILKADVLRFISGDYEAIICDKRMVVFQAQFQELTYCAAVDPDSEFDW